LIPAFVFLQILNNLVTAYMLMIGALISNAFSLIFLLIESVVTSETD
ncbi:membrane protein, partial [Helicobacter pylori PZ5024]